MATPAPPAALSCGTVATVSGEAGEAMLDAVREANGRRALRPAVTVEEAAADIEAFLVCPAWSEGQDDAAVAAETLAGAHALDALAHPLVWTLYTEGARRLGFSGAVPVPVLETGPAARA